MYCESKRFRNKIAVVTGAGGVLCSAICKALAQEGALVALLDIDREKTEKVAERIMMQGNQSLVVEADVTDVASIKAALRKVLDVFGRIDILINGAGGNCPKASTGNDLTFFDISQEAIEEVLRLNLLGTITVCQVFGKVMAEAGSGVILNIASINAIRPLTRIPAYSAAKSAVTNFTEWLAIHMTRNYSTKIRVNAVAPGFFLSEQNRYLLIDETGELTKRGRQIIEQTPLARFGEPRDLVGTVLFLLSEEASFVNGTIIPVDGGFQAYSGV